MKYHHQVCF